MSLRPSVPLGSSKFDLEGSRTVQKSIKFNSEPLDCLNNSISTLGGDTLSGSGFLRTVSLPNNKQDLGKKTKSYLQAVGKIGCYGLLIAVMGVLAISVFEYFFTDGATIQNHIDGKAEENTESNSASSSYIPGIFTTNDSTREISELTTNNSTTSVSSWVPILATSASIGFVAYCFCCTEYCLENGPAVAETDDEAERRRKEEEEEARLRKEKDDEEKKRKLQAQQAKERIEKIENDAATKLQATARMYLSKKELKNKKLEKQNKEEATIKIQAAVRAKLAKNRVKILKKQQENLAKTATAEEKATAEIDATGAVITGSTDDAADKQLKRTAIDANPHEQNLKTLFYNYRYHMIKNRKKNLVRVGGMANPSRPEYALGQIAKCRGFTEPEFAERIMKEAYQSGYKYIISLAPLSKTYTDEFEKLGGTHISFPVPDMSHPSIEASHKFVEELMKILDSETGDVLIHCGEGWGRTGTILSILKLYEMKVVDSIDFDAMNATYAAEHGGHKNKPQVLLGHYADYEYSLNDTTAAVAFAVNGLRDENPMYNDNVKFITERGTKDGAAKDMKQTKTINADALDSFWKTWSHDGPDVSTDLGTCRASSPTPGAPVEVEEQLKFLEVVFA